MELRPVDQAPLLESSGDEEGQDMFPPDTTIEDYSHSERACCRGFFRCIRESWYGRAFRRVGKFCGITQRQPGTQTSWYYVGCFFVTIASVLGTGILGVPVSTAQSGFYPFLVIFIVVLIMEEVVIIFFVEVLQHASLLIARDVTNLAALKRAARAAKQTDSVKAINEEDVGLQGSEGAPVGYLEFTDEPEEEDFDFDVNEQRTRPSKREKLNLHAIGRLFLPWGGRYAFDLVVYLQFLAFLISYVLAGSEAWTELFGIGVGCQDNPSSADERDLRLVIAAFGVIFTAFIIFGQRLFTSVVSLITALKVSLLILMVIIVMVVAIEDHIDFSNDWSAIADAFLLSTVAMGGGVNLMPLLFDRVPLTRKDVHKFRLAVMLGLFFCGVLVVLWTLFIMLSVPQEGPISLNQAEQNGCIATVPLTSIISQDDAQLNWIAYVVEVFIVVSITVSYITVGSGLKNFLDGYVTSWAKFCNRYLDKTAFARRPRWIRWFSAELVLKAITYSVTFGICVGVALGKPSCFLAILEYFASFVINLESGFFIAFMVIVSVHYTKKMHLKIPVALPQPWATIGAYFTGIFFLGATVWDIVDLTMTSISDGGIC